MLQCSKFQILISVGYIKWVTMHLGRGRPLFIVTNEMHRECIIKDCSVCAFSSTLKTVLSSDAVRFTLSIHNPKPRSSSPWNLMKASSKLRLLTQTKLGFDVICFSFLLRQNSMQIWLFVPFVVTLHFTGWTTKLQESEHLPFTYWQSLSLISPVNVSEENGNHVLRPCQRDYLTLRNNFFCSHWQSVKYKCDCKPDGVSASWPFSCLGIFESNCKTLVW